MSKHGAGVGDCPVMALMATCPGWPWIMAISPSPSMLRLLGKVWPVGGPLLVSSQRGKGPFGVGGNGVRFFADCAAKKWPLPGQQEPGIILPVKTNIDKVLSMSQRNAVTTTRSQSRGLDRLAVDQ